MRVGVRLPSVARFWPDSRARSKGQITQIGPGGDDSLRMLAALIAAGISATDARIEVDFVSCWSARRHGGAVEDARTSSTTGV